ncbi:hypothetical protein BKA80DRAFT_64732 [Phyllosticta citrichinensis]
MCSRSLDLQFPRCMRRMGEACLADNTEIFLRLRHHTGALVHPTRFSAYDTRASRGVEFTPRLRISITLPIPSTPSPTHSVSRTSTMALESSADSRQAGAPHANAPCRHTLTVCAAATLTTTHFLETLLTQSLDQQNRTYLHSASTRPLPI